MTAAFRSSTDNPLLLANESNVDASQAAELFSDESFQAFVSTPMMRLPCAVTGAEFVSFSRGHPPTHAEQQQLRLARDSISDLTVSVDSFRANDSTNDIDHTNNNNNNNDVDDNSSTDRVSTVQVADHRTTLMIKNIPNKFTQSVLRSEIATFSDGRYDFLYLPIDFMNRCNLGYAFVNLISHLDVLQFHHNLHGRAWSTFNSSKICELAYARIQSKQNLIAPKKTTSTSLRQRQRHYVNVNVMTSTSLRRHFYVTCT